MVAEVFCGLVQITTNVGFAVTMDKESFHFWHMWDPRTGDGPYVCRLTIKRMDKLNVRHQITQKKIHQCMYQNHGLEKNRTVMTATVKNRPIVLTRNGVCTGLPVGFYIRESIYSFFKSPIKPFCQNHPKCDPKCKGDGCNHPDCKEDPRCPQGERDESKISQLIIYES